MALYNIQSKIGNTGTQPISTNPDDYGAYAAPLREALGFGGQNDVDLLAPSRVSTNGGSDGGGGDMLKPSPALQRMIDQGLVGYGNMQMHDPSSPDQMGYWVNWDKMPRTAFGQPVGGPGNSSISAYDPSMNNVLLNQQAVYKDPNYGWITPTRNVDTQLHGLDALIYNAAPALAITAMTAGAGLGGLTSQGMRAMQQLPSFGRGFNPMSLAGMGLGMGLGYMGLPPIARMGGSFLGNMFMRRRR